MKIKVCGLKYPENIQLRMISANNALSSGFYKFALRKFISFPNNQIDPFVPFLGTFT